MGTAVSGPENRLSTNALGSELVALHGFVGSRVGSIMNLTWNRTFTVLTSTGHFHLFDAAPTPAAADGQLPRLRGQPRYSLPLRECTVAVADNNPEMLKVDVTLHAKWAPAKTYT